MLFNGYQRSCVGDMKIKLYLNQPYLVSYYVLINFKNYIYNVFVEIFQT